MTFRKIFKTALHTPLISGLIVQGCYLVLDIMVRHLGDKVLVHLLKSIIRLQSPSTNLLNQGLATMRSRWDCTL